MNNKKKYSFKIEDIIDPQLIERIKEKSKEFDDLANKYKELENCAETLKQDLQQVLLTACDGARN